MKQSYIKVCLFKGFYLYLPFAVLRHWPWISLRIFLFFFNLPSSLFVLSDLSHSSLHRKSVKEHSGGAVMRKLDPSGKLSRSNLSRRATNVSNTLGGWAHTAANTICKHN